jgi:hypothetical protein
MGKWKLKDLFWVSSSTPEPIEPEETIATSITDDREPPASQDPPIERVLSMLRDVDGVVGSIAVANAGQLLGSDLPRMFDAAGTEALAMRLCQLQATLASAGGHMKTASFRYESHALHVSQLDCGLLGILAELRTREPALEMATRLVGKQLDAAVSASTS